MSYPSAIDDFYTRRNMIDRTNEFRMLRFDVENDNRE